MLKIIVILIFFPALFLFFISEKPKAVSDSFPTPSPTKTPANENGIEDAIVDKDTVYLVCPGDRSRCTEDNLTVKIKILSKNAEKNNLDYYYLVSGGQLIGEGANVIWNFSNTRPGKYTITASVGKDNIIYGKTITKTIELKECPECDYWGFCECPTINVSGPTKSIKAGKSFIVTAKVSGGTQESVGYNWKITNGEITSGQNSAQIIVKTDPNKKDFLLVATVELIGICEACLTEASETFTIK